MLRNTLFVAMLAASFLFAETAIAVITLSEDFDSGSLNTNLSTVSGSNVTLVPRLNGGGSYTQNWWALQFRMDGVQGITPQFKITKDPATYRFPQSTDRLVYSYDQTNWQYFNKGSTDSTYYYFSNNAAFTSNTVYVSVMLPYPTSRTDSFVASIKGNQYVNPTASGDANLVIGQTLGTAGGGYLDDMGRAVPSLPLYGFHVTDPSATGQKTKIVLMSGNHSGEMLGQYVVEGAVNWLIGSSPEAAALRKVADFYVYPSVDPEGRYSGYFRGSPNNSTVDHNRIWTNTPTASKEVAAIKAAMRADTGGATYFADLHVDWNDDFPYGTTAMHNSSFFQNWMKRDPAYTSSYLYHDPVPGNSYDTMAFGWAQHSFDAGGLGAMFSMTPENGMNAGVTAAGLYQRGANIGLAFYDTLVSPVPEPSSMLLLLIACGAAMFWRCARSQSTD